MEVQTFLLFYGMHVLRLLASLLPVLSPLFSYYSFQLIGFPLVMLNINCNWWHGLAVEIETLVEDQNCDNRKYCGRWNWCLWNRHKPRTNMKVWYLNRKLNAARVFYDEYAKREGFLTRIVPSRKSEHDGTIISRRLACNKEGFNLSSQIKDRAS